MSPCRPSCPGTGPGPPGTCCGGSRDPWGTSRPCPGCTPRPVETVSGDRLRSDPDRARRRCPSAAEMACWRCLDAKGVFPAKGLVGVVERSAVECTRIVGPGCLCAVPPCARLRGAAAAVRAAASKLSCVRTAGVQDFFLFAGFLWTAWPGVTTSNRNLQVPVRKNKSFFFSCHSCCMIHNFRLVHRLIFFCSVS